MYARSAGFRLAVREASPVIVLVLDVSDSMNATDVAPDRLSAAETAARAFLDELLPTPGSDSRRSPAGRVAVLHAGPRGRGRVGELTTSKGTVIDGLAVALDTIEELRSATPDTPAAALLLSDGHDTGPGHARPSCGASRRP